MENSEQKTENGEQRMENREWRTENGEQRTGNSEQKTENGEQQTESIMWTSVNFMVNYDTRVTTAVENLWYSVLLMISAFTQSGASTYHMWRDGTTVPSSRTLLCKFHQL